MERIREAEKWRENGGEAVGKTREVEQGVRGLTEGMSKREGARGDNNRLVRKGGERVEMCRSGCEMIRVCEGEV